MVFGDCSHSDYLLTQIPSFSTAKASSFPDFIKDFGGVSVPIACGTAGSKVSKLGKVVIGEVTGAKVKLVAKILGCFEDATGIDNPLTTLVGFWVS